MFKKVIVLSLLLLFLNPTKILGHGDGASSYLLLNEKTSLPNPAFASGASESDIVIPHSLASENYLVNQNIDFEIDTEDLENIIPHENLETTRFEWDFGDGVKASGLASSHQYKKIGSYVLVLTVRDKTNVNKLTDSFLLNIVPTKNFSDLPKAVIKVDGKKVDDPVKETLEFSLNKEIKVDASESSGKIAEYLWVFGDSQTSIKKENSHKYTSGDFQTLVLRVRDENGFISDSYVSLISSERAGNSASNLPKIISITAILALIALSIIVLMKKLS